MNVAAFPTVEKLSTERVYKWLNPLPSRVLHSFPLSDVMKEVTGVRFIPPRDFFVMMRDVSWEITQETGLRFDFEVIYPKGKPQIF